MNEKLIHVVLHSKREAQKQSQMVGNCKNGRCGFKKLVSFLGCELSSCSCILNGYHIVLDKKWQKSLASLSKFNESLLSQVLCICRSRDLCHYGLLNVCIVVCPINCKVALELTVAWSLNPRWTLAIS